MKQVENYEPEVKMVKSVSRKKFFLVSAKGIAALTLGSMIRCSRNKLPDDPGILIGHVISHTHWDRAWYLPFEQFRLRLVQLIQKLLALLENNPGYKFCLDGQTIVLEDYLEIYPGDIERIRNLVKKKQLAVGPFYCQPDQFLITGESLIRNMMIGIRQANELGGVQMEGLLGDNFGHPSQIPQLLQGFGIRSLFTSATRGIPKDKLKNGWVQRWIAPDKRSSVPAYFFGENYANLYYWGFDNFNPREYPTLPPDATEWSLDLARTKLEQVLEIYQSGKLNTRHIFLGNGVDHQEAQPHVPEIIKALNGKQGKIHLLHSSYEELMDAVLEERKELPEIEGPLGDDNLFGTMTSRIYLIQDYTRIASSTEMLTEPLLALADIFGSGHRVFRESHHYGFTFNPGQNWPGFPYYPKGQMEYVWKLLLKNAPHDDICGCSVDATHRDMENRFKRAEEITTLLWKDAFLVLAGRLLEHEPDSSFPKLIVFNPHPFPWTERITARVSLQDVYDPERIRVTDENGRELIFAVDDAVIKEYPQWDGNDFNEQMMFKGLELNLSFQPSLEPCSFSVFSIDTHPNPSGTRKNTRDSLPKVTENHDSVEVENSFYRICILRNGTFDLYDKELKKTYRRLGALEDVEDIGDSYTFRRFKNPAPPVTSEKIKGTLRVIAHDEISTKIEVSFELDLPAALDSTRESRDTKLVPSPVKMLFEIPHYRKGGRLTFELENQARDHHLLMYFPAGVKASEFLYDSKFDLSTYPVGYEKARLDSIAIASSSPDDAFGLVVDCPTIVRSRHGKDGEIEFGWTIVRAVDHVNASIPLEYWAAFEAQCLRKIIRRIEWCTGSFEDVRSLSLRLRRITQVAPPVLSLKPSKKNQYQDSVYTTLRLDPVSMIEIEGKDIQLSAWKKAEDHPGWIVRVYSLGEKEIECLIRAPLPIKEVYLTDLNEQPGEKLSGSSKTGFSFGLRPKEIKTLLLVLDEKALAAYMNKKQGVVRDL